MIYLLNVEHFILQKLNK